MKVFMLPVVMITTFASGQFMSQVPENTNNSAYRYLMNVGVPSAYRIRAEEDLKSQSTRIVGGVPAMPGEYPWQAGIIVSIMQIEAVAVCGGSLVTEMRVVTAAHCWFDGANQAWKFTVVLGSILLFSGGVRLDTSAVIVHPDWTPYHVRNDVAVTYLPTPVTFSTDIAPIALPTGTELYELFVGEIAVATGFGLTADRDSILESQNLSHIRLSVLTNVACAYAFPYTLHDSHLCAAGIGGTSTCKGDSGGPLIIIRKRKPILIGISSFVSSMGCQYSYPAGYSRVTYFVDFFTQHM